MAKVTYNPAIQDLRGSVSRLVFRTILGQSVVSPKPDHNPKRVRSAAEAATNTRFYFAAAYAKHVKPDMAARYAERARLENKTQFSIRTRDYMVSPKIHAAYLLGYSGRAGEEILVAATDDFEVKEVRVRMVTSSGRLLEEGVASRCKPTVFRYVTQADLLPGESVRIEITARDWPDNKSTWQSVWPEPAAKSSQSAEPRPIQQSRWQ